MKININDKEACVSGEAFVFLTQKYDFEMKYAISNKNGFRFIYYTDKVAVTVCYEAAEAYVNITLHRLREGLIVQDTFPRKANWPVYNVGLDLLVSYRNVAHLTKPLYDETSDYYNKTDAFKIMVSRLADNLINYAGDVLRGDFAVFDELKGSDFDRLDRGRSS